MTSIGITGASGLIGWHFRCQVDRTPDADAVLADRETFASDEKLAAFVRACDVIVHLAAVNRGTDSEVADVNPWLAERLVGACETAGVTPHIVYTSSIHEQTESIYGRAKRGTGDILAAWAERTGAVFSRLVLPHVFGELGRPFHNSVVSTFAYQLANQATPEVHNDAGLELMHASAVGDAIMATIESRAALQRPTGHKITVRALLDTLQGFDTAYRASGFIPAMQGPLDTQLFNTYRSYLFPDFYPFGLTVHTDERGRLFEAVKEASGGQTFLSDTAPGITRGNHYHVNKIERFIVVEGRARIQIRRLFSTDVAEFDVSGDEPCLVDMPTLHTHNITNTGDSTLMTLFWSSEIFDPDNPDTYFQAV